MTQQEMILSDCGMDKGAWYVDFAIVGIGLVGIAENVVAF